MASHLSPLSLSPIDKLPYDALREVFLHCVPTYPKVFDHRFETTSIIIILSHVCSSWRVVVHTSPRLWRYLSLTVSAENRHGRLMVLKRHVDLIRLWRSKHGTILPFIVLRVQSPFPFEKDQLIEEDAFTFILEYLASAQYLNIDELIWDKLATRKIACPNLRDVVLVGGGHDSDNIVSNFQSVIGLAPAPSLQRLTMLFITLYLEDVPLLSGPWSSLTHLTLWNLAISLHFWFTFVRAVPSLQWAYFNIYKIEVDYKNLIEYTLLKLCSLFIECIDVHVCDLFSNLYLPTLHTLSISLRGCSSWTMPEDAIAELPMILKRAPSITTLGLSENFLPYENDWEGSDYSAMGSPSTPEPSMDTIPLWTHTPHLTHLLFEKLSRIGLEHMEEHVGLYRSDCPIRKLTVVDKKLRNAAGNSTEWQNPVLSEYRSKLGRNILVEFDTKALDQKAWAASKTWELVD